MKFGEIVAPSMKQLFISRIEDLILSGELQPGEKLPSERELADEMNISKTVVHEGIRELAKCGFLDVVSRKGVTVADYVNTGNIDTLIAIMNRNARNLDKRTACSLLDFRCYLECPALKILGSKRTEQDIAEIEAREKNAIVLSKKANLNASDFAEALYLYHRTIMNLSGNTITPLVLNALTPAVIPFWLDYMQICGITETLNRLSQFTTLIKEQEGEKAAALLWAGTEAYKKERGYI